MHTFTLFATPVIVEHHDGWTSVALVLFENSPERHTFEVERPEDIAPTLSAWAHNAPLPDRRDGQEPFNAWSVHTVKPARWPSGFKQAGERTHTFVV